MNSATHVDTAGQRNPQLTREFHTGEVTIELVHECFDDWRTICGCAVAMGPSLGMDNIGNGVSRTAHRKANFLRRFNDGLHILLIWSHEFNVISTGKPKVPITILIGNITNIPDTIDTD